MPRASHSPPTSKPSNTLLGQCSPSIVRGWAHQDDKQRPDEMHGPYPETLIAHLVGQVRQEPKNDDRVAMTSLVRGGRPQSRVFREGVLAFVAVFSERLVVPLPPIH